MFEKNGDRRNFVSKKFLYSFPLFFTKQQVEKYASNWFALDESVERDRQLVLTDSFMEDSRFVHDLRVNPLMLALMCGIYASERYIPKNRPDVYEKCANLLLDRWDRQRNIKMALPFDAHVQRAMRVLALKMYRDPEAQSGVSRAKLVGIMTEYLLAKRFKEVEEAEDAANQFVDFCKGRAWVLSEVGADLYSFTHRTFLEYFAASQLVQECTSADKLFDELHSEIALGTASIVHQLALQILGKHTENGADEFCRLTLDSLKQNRTVAPVRASHEAQFLASSLNFLVPHPNLIDDLVRQVVMILVNTDRMVGDPQHMGRVLRILSELELASEENVPSIQDSMRRHLEAAAANPDTRIRALSIAWGYPANADRSLRGQHALAPWADWTSDLRDFALLEAQVESERSQWAAIASLGAGNLSTRDVVSKFGLVALFGSDTEASPLVGDIPVAPLFLVMGNNSTGLEESDADSVAAGIISGTLDHRFPALSRSSIATIIIYAIRSSERPSGLTLLLLLPVIEALAGEDDPRSIYGRHRSGRERMPEWVASAISVLRGEPGSQTSTISDLATTEPMRQLVNLWIEGRIRFFGSNVSAGEMHFARFG